MSNRDKQSEGQKSAYIEPIRLMKKQESFEVFPIHERVSSDLSEEEVMDMCEEMGMESVVVNGIIKYRDALRTLEQRYSEDKFKFNELGFELALEPFIPQYIGFEERMSSDDQIMYYKDGILLMPSNEGWSIFNGNGQPVVNQIDNMLEGISVVKFFGADVSIADYLEKF